MEQPSGPRVIGVSVAGPGHEKNGVPCQDAYGYHWLENGSLILAVADGAGSACYAHLGARTAVEAAVSCPPAENPEQQVRASLEAAHAAVMRAATELGESPRELATTLLVCLWHPDLTAVGHVGDGAAVVWLGEERGFRVLAAPGHSEYINETRFLTDRAWQSAIEIQVLPEAVSGLILMTDGCQRAALRRQNGAWEAFAPFLAPILKFAREVESQEAGEAGLEQLLVSTKLAAHSDDDKTLLLLTLDHAVGGNG